MSISILEFVTYRFVAAYYSLTGRYVSNYGLREANLGL